MNDSNVKEPNLFKREANQKPKKKGRFLDVVVLAVLVLIVFHAVDVFFDSTLKLEGKAHAARELEIACQTEGVLKEAKVRDSGVVKEGEDLFEFENRDLNAELLAAVEKKETLQERLLQIQDELSLAERRLKSAQILFENGVISRLDLEETGLRRSKLKSDVSEKNRLLEEASLKAKLLQDKKDSLTIKAPFGGIFLGDLTSKIGLRFTPAELLGVLYDPEQFSLEAEIPEKMSTHIQIGDKALVRFKAFPGQFQGTVTEVEAQVREEVEKVYKTKHILKIRISLESSPSGLKPGMRASAKMISRNYWESLEERFK